MDLPKRRSLAILACGLALALPGCGDDDEDTTAATTTPTGATGATGAEGGPAADADAQSAARTAQTALETYAVDQGGSYAGADSEALSAIEPSLPGDIEVEADESTYTVTATSDSGNAFTIKRTADGAVTMTCTEPGVGDCGEDGEW